MNNSEFNDYIVSYIQNHGNVNDTRKIRIFIKHIKEYIGEQYIDIEVFSILGKEFFLDSVEAYIKDNNPSKQAATDYKRVIIDLCKNVCDNKNIKNEFLESNSQKRQFDDICSKWIDNLKEPTSRECISFDDYEKLDDTVNDFLSTENLRQCISESLAMERPRYNYYGRLVSAIALKLIQTYGLSNKTISNLRLSDYEEENRILRVNGFELILCDELSSYLELYLSFRSLVIEKNNVHVDYLFIKSNGTPYLNRNNSVDAGSLFLLLNAALETNETSGLRYKMVRDMVLKGANFELLSKLTGVAKEKISQISSDYDSDLKKHFIELLSGSSICFNMDPSQYVKGLIRCPYCGDYKDSTSNNWILIEVGGDSKKYLACRECKGLDGKIRY